MISKTFSIKPSEVKKDWLLVDATDQVLGRLATQIATLLRGKHKAVYTPHMDAGDNVILINVEKIKLTGNKTDKKDGKLYYRHTGFPGGIKKNTAGNILAGKYPERVVKMAVARMLPKNKLSHKLIGNLYLYSGDTHPHAAQSPKPYIMVTKQYKNTKK